jgi:hypothetical protein
MRHPNPRGETLPGPSTPMQLDRRVPRDLKKPCGETRGGSELPNALMESDEHILRDVLRVVRVTSLHQSPPMDLLMALADQLLKRRSVTLPRALGERRRHFIEVR